MSVDAVGLLYIADSSRRDVQVWDFRGNNAVALLAQSAKSIEMGALEAAAVAPDGQLAHGWRWYSPSFTLVS